MEKYRVAAGYQPGAIGRITEMHAAYYYRHWGFGLYFERKVATELSEFLGRLDASRDGLWLAMDGQELLGSIAIDGERATDQGAHLRWFIVAAEHQGRGMGKRLLEEALGFCDDRGFRRVYLWTFAGLDRARRLYESHNFVLCSEKKGVEWGVASTEQLFERVNRV